MEAVKVVPWYLGSWVPWYLLPWYLGTMVPWYLIDEEKRLSDSVDVCVCDSEVLARCVYTAYKARRSLLHTADTAGNMMTVNSEQQSDCVRQSSCLMLCNRASRLLSECISQLDAAPSDHISKVCLLYC